jgi:hypothetical protein
MSLKEVSQALGIPIDVVGNWSEVEEDFE